MIRPDASRYIVSGAGPRLASSSSSERRFSFRWCFFAGTCSPGVRASSITSPSTTGASSTSVARARDSAVADRIMASAAAWSDSEGAGAPTVVQAEFSFFRKSALRPATWQMSKSMV
jgi:hypothetical protein